MGGEADARGTVKLNFQALPVLGGVFFGFNIILKFSVSCQCMLASAFLSLARNRIWKTHFLYPVINRIGLSQYSICNSHVSKIN